MSVFKFFDKYYFVLARPSISIRVELNPFRWLCYCKRVGRFYIAMLGPFGFGFHVDKIEQPKGEIKCNT